jgi:hypothetical protein
VIAASEQAQQSNRRCYGSGDCEAKFWLHDEEGAQLRFEFETEIKRPEAARYCSVMAGVYRGHTRFAQKQRVDARA